MSSSFELNKSWNHNETVSNSYLIEFSISSQTGDIIIKIDAPFHDNPPPSDSSAQYNTSRCENLYEYEVVEIFIATPSNDYNTAIVNNPYLEIEIGPYGHYYLVCFTSEADFANQDNNLYLDIKPVININKDIHRWTGEISLPSYLLPEPICKDDCSVNWNININAIYDEYQTQTSSKPIRKYLSYSKLSGNKPNFHQLNAFVPLVLFETIDIKSKVDRSISIANELITKNKNKSNNIVNFSPSTIQSDITKRLQEEVRVFENMNSNNNQKLSKQKLSNLEDNNNNDELLRPNLLTVDIVASRIRQDQLKSAVDSATLEVDSKIMRHIQSDEFVVLHGSVVKRRGWLSYKNRNLILTNRPRLLYTNMDGVYKGSIAWTVVKPISVEKIDESNFDIILHDNSRRYHIRDKVNGATKWVNAINQFLTAQVIYFKTTTGTV
eukprot:gene7754-10533_t